MVKKAKQEVEEIDESYYSQSSDEDVGSNGMREIDTANIGNYASDSDSDGDMLANIQSQKEEAIALNNTWGQKKANFYGRNKESDENSDTSDDQDEEEQAERLQAIKAKKMKLYM